MNRREFFKMIFGAGVACVLPKGAEVAPEVEQTSNPLVWKSTPIHLHPAWTPDETTIVMLNNNGTVAGLIHII